MPQTTETTKKLKREAIKRFKWVGDDILEQTAAGLGEARRQVRVLFASSHPTSPLPLHADPQPTRPS